MAHVGIDYDRGVEKHMDPTGVAVYMYADEPGTYRNAYGTEVAVELAKSAGFNVDTLSKAKLKRERMAAAMAAIEAEIEGTGEVSKKIVAVRGGFRLVDIGLERFNVEDPDGNVLNKTPLPKSIAASTLEKLVPGAETEQCEEVKEVEADNE